LPWQSLGAVAGMSADTSMKILRDRRVGGDAARKSLEICFIGKLVLEIFFQGTLNFLGNRINNAYRYLFATFAWELHASSDFLQFRCALPNDRQAKLRLNKGNRHEHWNRKIL
jgi:hypothetical protein